MNEEMKADESNVACDYGDRNSTVRDGQGCWTQHLCLEDVFLCLSGSSECGEGPYNLRAPHGTFEMEGVSACQQFPAGCRPTSRGADPSTATALVSIIAEFHTFLSRRACFHQ